MIEDAEVGPQHLQLRLDLQICALAGRLDDIVAAARHGEVHVLAIADFNVQPVNAGRFQFADLRAQRGVIRPEQAGGDFDLLRDFSDGHFYPSPGPSPKHRRGVT